MTEDRQTLMSEEMEQQQKALSMKSDEELKTIVHEESIYGPEFVRAVRKELTARVAGKRRQKTAEEIRHEEEEERKAEAERQLKEEEERARREAERAVEAERIAAANKRMARRAAVIVPIVLALVALIGFFLWNNTAGRLTERGRQALANDREKAKKLLERAADKEITGVAAFELYNMNNSDYYLKKAADHGHIEANAVYGKQLLKGEKYAQAIPYLSRGLYDNADAEKHYLLGCAYFATGQTDAAKAALEEATQKGCREAYARLGDWYLCCGRVYDFEKALKCYQNAPRDWPGIIEKRQVLEDLQKRASRSGWGDGFGGDSWDNGNQRFYGEGSNYGTRSVLRGIYYQNPESHRIYGKFSASKRLLNGMGILSYKDGRIYAGNLNVVSKGNSYTVYYSGKGTMTYSTGTTRKGMWKNDQLTGSFTGTDIFGHTISYQN